MRESAIPKTASAYKALRNRARILNVRQFAPHPPETVVRYLGQVDMMNYIAGNPPVEYEFIPSASGGTFSRGTARKGGLTLSYDELPYEWSFPFWSRAENFPVRGPFEYIGLDYDLIRKEGGTEIDFRFRWVGKGLGLMAFLVVLKFKAGIKHALETLSRRAETAANDPLAISPFLDEDGRKNGINAQELAVRFDGIHMNTAVAQGVADFVATAPEKVIARLRPLQVAAQYKLPERDVIEFFLRATRRGFFNMSWDILCPGCRGDKGKYAALGDIRTEAHCDYCDIKYDADFTANVELTFRPVNSVRQVFAGSYCINSPGNTLFVHSQINVFPDEPVTVDFHFPGKVYRLKSPQFPATRDVVIAGDGATSAAMDLAMELGPDAPAAAFHLAPNARITFVGAGEGPVTVRFVRDEYRDYALSASRVTALQEFRDQFGSEALSPGLQIGVENLCFLFTDLKDSTPMYETMGDAPAFALVRDHFVILMDEVRKHDGAVVKTIGDAVMAVFVSSPDAVRAAVGIQERIRREHPRVGVKIGLHAGPCLAVNSNDKLDYFGATVNRAARIQGLADAGDVILSPVVESAPAVETPPSFSRVEFQGVLKGITSDARLARWHLKS